MDQQVPNAEGTPDGAYPWLAFYPPGVPATIESPPYEFLGELAADLAARKPTARAFTTVMPNGMAASLSFAEVNRYSDDFAAYLREILLLEPELVIPVGRLAIERFIPCPRMDEVIGTRFRSTLYGREFDLIPLPHPSGASPWPHQMPGRVLLPRALALIAAHPAWRQSVGLA